MKFIYQSTGIFRVSLVLVAITVVAGCTSPAGRTNLELTVRDAIENYRVDRSERLTPDGQAASQMNWVATAWSEAHADTDDLPEALLTFGVLAPFDDVAESRPTAADTKTPEGYWRRNIWHQMGYEAKDFGTRGFWRGFKTSYWDVENALTLAATMGASVAIREGGVDDAIRRRVRGHRQLGEFDESIQLLGNPATHFAGAGVLWLTSALMEDEKQHEVAKKLTQALAVNGVSTLLLKGATNTRGPDNERHAWPSGHTSSAFTVAGVLNEYYGPWVGVPSLALAGLVGYQRIDSRSHDFSDVVFGAVMGYVIGSSIANDGKAEFPELFGMQVVPFADPETGTTGIALMKSW
ncbi:MAG: phosphatase PAP2 family protein [Planctomycetota bacterium]